MENESRENAIKRQGRILETAAKRIKYQLRKELNRTIKQALENYKLSPSIDNDIFLEHQNRVKKIAQDGFYRAFKLSSISDLKTFQKVKWIDKQTNDSILAEIETENELFSSISASTVSKHLAATTKADINQIIEKIESEKKLNSRELNTWLDDIIADSVKALSDKVTWRSYISAFAWAHSGQHKGSQSSAERTVNKTGRKLYKIWETMQDDKVRDTHKPMQGAKVEHDQPWRVPTTVGTVDLMMYPGDMRASIGNWINCLHPDTKINYTTPNALTRREYTGKLITIKTKSGNEISVTVNHPILTISGWKKASEIIESDCIICADAYNPSGLGLYVQNTLPTVKQIYDLSSVVTTPDRVRSAIVDFHGERPKKDIDIIWNNRFLGRWLKGGSFFDPIKKFRFKDTDFAKGLFFCNTLFGKPFNRCFFIASCLMCFFGNPFTFFDWCLTHSQKHRFPSVSRLYSKIIKASDHSTSFNGKVVSNKLDAFSRLKFFFNFFINFISLFFVGYSRSEHLSGNGIFLAKGIDRSPIFIFSDNISEIKHDDYSGYVYNLSDDKGYYVANGIIARNCRCVKRYSTT